MKVLIKATNEIKEVSTNYAVSYLIPKGLAVVATDKVLRDVKEKEDKKQQDREQQSKRQAELATKLNNQTFVIKVKANEVGELFGSIGKPQIKKALNTNDPIEFRLDQPIKKVGKYPLELKMGSHKAKVVLDIVASQVVAI